MTSTMTESRYTPWVRVGWPKSQTASVMQMHSLDSPGRICAATTMTESRRAPCVHVARPKSQTASVMQIH